MTFRTRLRLLISALVVGSLLGGLVFFNLTGPASTLPDESTVHAIPRVETANPGDAGTAVAPDIARTSDRELKATSESSDNTAPIQPNPDARSLSAGWILGNSSAYTAERDRSTVYSGTASLRLASRIDEPQGFGNVGQIIRADSYRGKRVKLTGHLRTMNASGWAGLWFRVDAADGKVLAFDNMGAPGRSLSGNTEWIESSLVLDVPESAAAMYYGVVLSGGGTVWMDALRIEVVDEGTPVTAGPSLRQTFNPPPSRTLPSSPMNLDFES